MACGKPSPNRYRSRGCTYRDEWIENVWRDSHEWRRRAEGIELKVPELRIKERRRKGLSGIIAAVILFAMFFTAGTGFFLAVNQFKHTADQANAGRLSSQQQASLENLALSAKVSSTADPWGHIGDLWLTINNTGGVPSTIVSVFITNSTGRLLSNSLVTPPSHYLSTDGGVPGVGGDLNVTLPLTLNVGASTSKVSGCKASVTGCDIGISKSSFLYTPHSTVLVSVLTSLGNVFSIPYPTPSLNTLKNVIVINQNQFNQENINQNQVDIVNQSETIGCSQCNFFLVAGGNILVTQITATPSPVANGKTINVTATVWDYSSYSAVDANVTLKSVYTGAASVLPDISASGESVRSQGGEHCPGGVLRLHVHLHSTGFRNFVWVRFLHRECSSLRPNWQYDNLQWRSASDFRHSCFKPCSGRERHFFWSLAAELLFLHVHCKIANDAEPCGCGRLQRPLCSFLRQAGQHVHRASHNS